MICRPDESGWLLITQAAHAWMAGELATIWGNSEFAAPEPRDAVLLATRLHDIGWMDFDTSPRLSNSGQPVDFLDITLSETMPIWRRAVQQVGMLNPYAALLVSMHATTIYRRRMERGANSPEDQSLSRELLNEQAEIQAELTSRLDGHINYGRVISPDRLRVVYRWLRACDLLSLALLSDRFPREGEIKAVPGRDWADLKSIHYQKQDPLTLILNPSPFSENSFKLTVEARYLEQKFFSDQDQYHSALASARWQGLNVTIQTPHTGELLA